MHTRKETLDAMRDHIDAGVWVEVEEDEAQAISDKNDLYYVHQCGYFYAVHVKIHKLYEESIKIKTEIPKERWVNLAPVVVTPRELALDECIGNYEEAISMVLARATAAEKDAKVAKKQLAKLVKVVMHSTKKPSILLAQAGITHLNNNGVALDANN